MRSVLSVSLPEKMATELDAIARATGRNKSDIVKESPGVFLWEASFRRICHMPVFMLLIYGAHPTFFHSSRLRLWISMKSSSDIPNNYVIFVAPQILIFLWAGIFSSKAKFIRTDVIGSPTWWICLSRMGPSHPAAAER